MSVAIQWRNDLEVIKLPAGGGVRVRDPIDSRYFEFNEEQWDAISKLKQSASASDWVSRLVVRENDPQQAAQGWSLFLSRLWDEGLVRGDRAGQRLESNRRIEQRGPWWASPWAIRLGGIRADLLTTFIHELVRPALASPVIQAANAFMLVTAVVLLGFLPRLVNDGSSTMSWFITSYPLLLPVLLVSVKIVHELGHAVMARHVGGSCRELGLMLFVGSPCLYADVSSCWMVPERRKRAAVTIAGSWIEGVIASVTFWLWLFTMPGVLHASAYFILVVVVVGNVVMNLNPLMRYDGYYLLSDAWGIPNLHQQARESLLRFWSRILLGNASVDATDENRERSRERSLLVFAIAAWCYRLFVVVVIVGALVLWASAYGLGWIAAAMGSVWLTTGFVVPTVRTATSLIRAQQATGNRWRGWSLLLGLAALILIAVLVPLPHAIVGQGVVQSSDAQPLYVPEESQLRSAADPSRMVNFATVVVELESWELERSILKEEQQLELLEKKIESWELAGDEIPEGESLIGLRADAERVRSELDVLRQRKQLLRLESQHSGWLVPHRRDADRLIDEANLDSWWGDPLHPTNRGAWFQAGTLLGWIVPDAGRVHVWAQVDERDLPSIRVGAPTTMRWSGAGNREIEGRVAEVGLAHAAAAEQQEDWGGWLERISAGKEVGHQVAWVKIEIEQQATPLVAIDGSTQQEGLSQGLRFLHDEPVQVQIETSAASLASRGWRWLSRQWHWAW